MIFFTTAGVAVLLTIITMFSTPILTTIFGDGSLEVKHIKPNKTRTRSSFASILNQWEDAEAEDEPAEVEVDNCTNCDHFKSEFRRVVRG